MTQHENQNVSQIKELCGDKRMGNPRLIRGTMKPDILDLLATPPTRGDKIAKNDSLEDGAAGIELFLLTHAFAQAGFPIRIMPAPRRRR